MSWAAGAQSPKSWDSQPARGANPRTRPPSSNRSSATRRRSAGSPSPDSPARSAAPAGRRAHRRADDHASDAVASTCDARPPDASTAASVVTIKPRRRGCRQNSRQRGKEGAIGEPQRQAPLLPCEHDQLMAQDEQLDVFAEVTAPAADQQPQHGRESEVSEGKRHPPILPSPQPGERTGTAEPPQRAGNRLRNPARFGTRARA